MSASPGARQHTHGIDVKPRVLGVALKGEPCANHLGKLMHRRCKRQALQDALQPVQAKLARVATICSPFLMTGSHTGAKG
eukprot:5511215-Amphidinium_carterae.1